MRQTPKSKHTPGPWFSGCKGSKDIQVVADDDSMAPVGTTSLVIAKVNASVEGAEANAALIAAAPAMYTLLQDATLQLARLTGSNLETYARTFSVLAKKALAQAEGAGHE